MFGAARKAGTVAVLMVLAFPCMVRAQTANPQNGPSPASLTIVTDRLPEPVARHPYHFQLVAQGGRPPYAWAIVEGELPPGLRLDPNAGTITGVPKGKATARFTVRVTDSSQPPLSATREVAITSAAALEMEWQREPVLENDGIYGEVKVGNPSKDSYDLTFIIVAVNQIGKAFALGYQHFTLLPQATQNIAFGSVLPLGSYMVHADAVGEVPAKDVIRRARLQTPEPLVKK